MEEDLTIFRIFFSIFLLVRFKASCIPKISLQAWLIMEITMKKTLKLGFGRWPQDIFNLQYFPMFQLFKSHIFFRLFGFKFIPCLRRIPNRCVCLSGQVYWHSTLNRLIYRTWPAETTWAVWWAICVHSHRDRSNIR